MRSRPAGIGRAGSGRRLVAGCEAYVAFGLAHPARYGVLFSEQRLGMQDYCKPVQLSQDGKPVLEFGAESFALLVQAIEDCVEAGASASTDAVADATAVWVAMHGTVTLRTALPGFPWPDRTGSSASTSARWPGSPPEIIRKRRLDPLGADRLPGVQLNPQPVRVNDVERPADMRRRDAECSALSPARRPATTSARHSWQPGTRAPERPPPTPATWTAVPGRSQPRTKESGGQRAWPLITTWCPDNGAVNNRPDLGCRGRGPGLARSQVRAGPPWAPG